MEQPLNPFHITDLYATLEKEGHSAYLRLKVGALLRRCLKHAVNFGLIHINVALKVPLPKATKNIKAVSARLGHRDIRETLDTYALFVPAMEAELVDAMQEILTPSLPKPPQTTTEALPPMVENSSATMMLQTTKSTPAIVVTNAC